MRGLILAAIVGLGLYVLAANRDIDIKKIFHHTDQVQQEVHQVFDQLKLKHIKEKNRDSKKDDDKAFHRTPPGCVVGRTITPLRAECR